MNTMKPQSYVCDLAPYQPGLPVELVAREYGLPAEAIIKLASNENPLGTSPSAVAAIEEAAMQAHRYPEQYQLIQALAAHHKLSDAQFVLGNGSNDILDLIARVYLGQGDEAISSQYGFAIYQSATQSTGAKNVVAPARKYGHDLQAMRAAVTSRTKVIWIANPNNPTGTFIPYEDIQSFVESVPPSVAIVLDEAYYEYLKLGDQEDTTQWLCDYPNVILVRTFSKIYGLAGLRIGYAMASPQVAELLNRLRQPFNGNNLALAAATAALQDQAFVQKSYTANIRGRDWLLAGLENMGLECLPAYGNFITFKVADASQVNQMLLRQGVIVRPLASYGMSDYLRVTVGLLKENERFLHALSGILQRS